MAGDGGPGADAGWGVEPETLRTLAARWSEVADLLDLSRGEVEALDPAVFDAAVLAAAVGFRDDLLRRVRLVVDEAETRAALLRLWLGDVERQDDEVARSLEGPR